MSKIFDDNSQTIGHTPLVRLKHFGNGNILAKIESRNPSFSIKCRIASNMIWDAEKRGLLTTDVELVEPTSGNTGIALAAVDPKHHLMLQQFSNPSNPEIHEKTTGPEIWQDTDGKIDIFVAGIGTGGTFTGITRYIKKTHGKNITAVAVEPLSSPVISQALAGQPLQPGPHKIQGIGAGFIPDNLDLSLIDLVEKVSNEEAIETARKIMDKEGILAGISSGAAVFVADKLAKLPENRDKTIVVILPSSGERYLSTDLFSGLFTEKELL